MSAKSPCSAGQDCEPAYPASEPAVLTQNRTSSYVPPITVTWVNASASASASPKWACGCTEGQGEMRPQRRVVHATCTCMHIRPSPSRSAPAPPAQQPEPQQMPRQQPQAHPDLPQSADVSERTLFSWTARRGPHTCTIAAWLAPSTYSYEHTTLTNKWGEMQGCSD